MGTGTSNISPCDTEVGSSQCTNGMSNISLCDTEVGSRQCTHFWKIENYSTTPQRQGGKQRSVKFSAVDDDFNWCLEHTVYMKSINQIHVSFDLRPDCYDDLRECESVSGNVEIIFMDVGHSRIYGNRHSFTLSDDEQNRNCKLVEYSMRTIEQYLYKDALEIFCRITYRKKNETVTTPYANNSSNTVSISLSESRVLNDMEKCSNEDRFKDVTISVKGKEFRAHKTILAARSTVFEKMLSADMLESKKNHIDITDVDHEPFEEMIYYIYTGKVKNLDESAFELLPVADKYDLEGLRSMCEEVLVMKLTTDNAAKILILADTHRAGELKAHTIRFIKENYESCEDFDDTEFWKHLLSVNARLFQEMIAAFCKRRTLEGSRRSSVYYDMIQF